MKVYDTENFIRKATSICFLIMCCVGAIFIYTNHVIPAMETLHEESKMSAGEIVDIKIINAHSGLFSSSDMDYRLVIQNKFEYKGETRTAKKSISVDKETYLQANVGDWFDSHTLEITEKK